jgi:hypothetical protein
LYVHTKFWRYDGDTTVVSSGEENITLLGVKTPESVKPNTPVEHYAKEAEELFYTENEAVEAGFRKSKK